MSEISSLTQPAVAIDSTNPRHPVTTLYRSMSNARRWFSLNQVIFIECPLEWSVILFTMLRLDVTERANPGGVVTPPNCAIRPGAMESEVTEPAPGPRSCPPRG